MIKYHNYLIKYVFALEKYNVNNAIKFLAFHLENKTWRKKQQPYTTQSELNFNENTNK